MLPGATKREATIMVPHNGWGKGNSSSELRQWLRQGEFLMGAEARASCALHAKCKASHFCALGKSIIGEREKRVVTMKAHTGAVWWGEIEWNEIIPHTWRTGDGDWNLEPICLEIIGIESNYNSCYLERIRMESSFKHVLFKQYFTLL